MQGDPSQVRRLLQNLIGNGLKFHKDGTKPEVAVLARKTEDSMIRIEVQDNGIGLDEAGRDQVFTMFRQLHSRTRYKGTGIGLSVCRKIVSRHGGDIGVDSIPGRGSTFWFTLPGLQQKEA
ncbi:MAG: ATP-binding protein [Pseudomonadota bacterium]